MRLSSIHRCGGRMSSVGGKGGRVRERARGGDVEREHSRLRVLGCAVVQGVTEGIHYLTVYCHSCGLRFYSGQEYRSITDSIYMYTYYIYICIRMTKCDIPFWKTRLKSRGFQLAAFSFIHDGTIRVASFGFKFIHEQQNKISFRIQHFAVVHFASSLSSFLKISFQRILNW